MSEVSLLEEDIWEYKSIRKLKSVDQNSEAICTNVHKANGGKSQRHGNRKTSEEKQTSKMTKQGPRQRSSQTPLKPDLHVGVPNDDPATQSHEGISLTSSKQKKNCKKQTPSKARPVYEGHCPSCQMPFSLLLMQTPHWHVTECLDGSRTAEKGTAMVGEKVSFKYICYCVCVCSFAFNRSPKFGNIAGEAFSITYLHVRETLT